MIQHVYERALEVKNARAVFIATDDSRIADAVLGFGGQFVMTAEEHVSGTSRLTEVMQKVDSEIYINIQGDEPLVRPEDVEALATAMLSDSTIDVATLCHHIDANEASNPNTVKVVTANNGDALYFSRSPIPYPRSSDACSYLKHVGVYAYRKRVLASYSALEQPMVEIAESLEQLRLLAAGYKVRTLTVEQAGPGVDTPECLEKVRCLMSGSSRDKTSRLSDIRLVITDVDGVLTDGGIFYDATGECLKRFHVRDGMGMRLLEENGVRVAVLSGRDSPTLRKRVFDLGINLCRFGVKDKYVACQQLMQEVGVEVSQTACIGDDSIDLPAFAACGISYAVSDAPSYVKAAATQTLNAAGGSGAFRELADSILTAQGYFSVLSTANGYSKVMAKMAQ